MHKLFSKTWRGGQGGSILFIILLVVILFAALCYAVMDSERGQVKDISEDAADMGASQLLNRAAMFQTAYNRMRIINGCLVKEIYMDMPNFTPDGSANATPRCNFYDPAGGGLNPERIPPNLLADTSLMNTGYVSGGHTDTWKLGFPRSMFGNSNASVALWAAYIPYNVCVAINRKVGLNAPTYVPPSVSFSACMMYSTGGSGINGAADGGNLCTVSLSNVNKQLQGCVQGNSTYSNFGAMYFQPDNTYHFFTILEKQ